MEEHTERSDGESCQVNHRADTNCPEKTPKATDTDAEEVEAARTISNQGVHAVAARRFERHPLVFQATTIRDPAAQEKPASGWLGPDCPPTITLMAAGTGLEDDKTMSFSERATKK